MREPLMILCMQIDRHTNEHVRYITFDLDDGKPILCYRSRVSYSAFAHSLKRRNCSKKHLYVCDHARDRARFMQKNVPMIEVPNLWDFYKLIGYDYKRKRFQEPS